MVPHVNSRVEAEALVEAAKFAPLGKRGMFTSRQGFGVSEYLKTANDQSLLMVLIEDIVGVKNLDEILKVDHIDVFFVAPNDLATSMGHIGNMGHPGRAADHRRRHQEDRRGPARGRHPREPGQYRALYQAGRPRGDDQLLPLDPGGRQDLARARSGGAKG